MHAHQCVFSRPGTTAKESILDSPRKYVTNEQNGHDPVCSFARKNYSLYATAGRDRAAPSLANTVLDTKSRTNSYLQEKDDLGRKSYFRLVLLAGPLHASKRAVKSCGLIHFSFHTKEPGAGLPFLLVQSLAAAFSLSRSLTDHRVEAILPPPRRAVFYYSRSAAITDQSFVDKRRISLSLKYDDGSRKVRQRGSNNFGSVLDERTGSTQDQGALLCSEQPEARHRAPHFSGERDYGRVVTQTTHRSSVQLLLMSSRTFSEHRL